MSSRPLRRSTSAGRLELARPVKCGTAPRNGLTKVPECPEKCNAPSCRSLFAISWAGIELDYIDRWRRRGPPTSGRLQRINTSESNWSSRRTNSHLRALAACRCGRQKCTRLTMSGSVLKLLPTLSQQNSRQHAKLGMLNRPQAKPAEAPLQLRAVFFRANSSGDTQLETSRPRCTRRLRQPLYCCDPP